MSNHREIVSFQYKMYTFRNDATFLMTYYVKVSCIYILTWMLLVHNRINEMPNTFHNQGCFFLI